MQLVSAEEAFTLAKEYLEGKKEDGTPCEQNLEKSEELLHEILNNNIGNITILYVLGSLYLSKGQWGLAIQLLSTVVQHSKNFGEAWNNLGLAFKDANRWEDASECAKRAASLVGHPDVLCNVAALHINRGMADVCLEWADKVLAKDPDHKKAQWHKALALLELGQFDTDAWDLHESRLEGGGSDNIAERNYHGGKETPWWDGTAPEKVVIHGEQGMGDEIMFATCVPDAIATGADIIFEPSPRLEGLLARSFPGIKVYGTDDVDGRRWVGESGPPDSKVALGSLPKFYRRSQEAFPSGAYLVPDPKRRKHWQKELNALNAKLKVGIAWQGGVQSTRVDARSFHPRMLKQLFKHDVQWMSLQYDVTAQQCVNEVLEETGTEILHWPKAVSSIDPDTGKASDLDELAAFISCLDLVISVPQTCYHVAGGLGVPCWVMCPSEPDWRLMMEGEKNPWYSSVEVIRQPSGTKDWNHVFNVVDEKLGAFIEGNSNADKR